jgi:hypothetical protein
MKPAVGGAVDLAHASRADLGKDFIRPEFVAGRERHESEFIALPHDVSDGKSQ